MSKNNNLISEALELLREVRVKVQGDVEDSVVQQLDEAISMLEEIGRQRPDRTAIQKGLELFGNALKVLPPIIKLWELFK